MTDNHTGGVDCPVRERRKHRRYFVDLPLDCRVIKNRRRGPVQVGIAENAGSGGLSINLSDRISPGNRLILELYYRDDYQFSSLKILSEVIWNTKEKEAHGYKHGLKLLRLENGGNLKLQSILKHCPIMM
jgi:hypothetical protein